MTAVYLFTAALGIPLVAWFLFGGGEEGGDDGGSGDDGGDGGHDSIGAIVLRLFPISTIAIAAAAFGVCGLALEAAGTDPPTAFGAAVVAALGAGILNTTAFRYLRQSESTTSVSDDQLTGATGRVVLPVGVTRRGRVALSAGGQDIYLSAQALPDSAQPDLELESGRPVLVVEVRNGIALVTPLDPELS